MPSPVIVHADMDAFYASVEQHDRPELAGLPVIVGGLGTRGVVSAASYEARRFGVHSAMPMGEARRLCPSGVFLAGRMERYGEVSRQIRKVFESFTPVVEPLSLDEAFLDVTASLSLFGPPGELGRALRARVRGATGLAVSVGIGPSKMVAKIASTRAKPDGLLEIGPDDVEEFLAPLPVGVLWGVGPKAQQALVAAGYRTVGDLARADAQILETRFGRFGRELAELAHGRDVRLVEADRGRKSYGEENTFAKDQREGPLLHGTIVAHAEAVARRLRADGARGRTVVLKLKLTERIGPGKYRLLTRSRTLARATDDGAIVADAALDLWRELEPKPVVRLVGVALHGIESSGAEQLALLEGDGTARRTALNRALDVIASRYGNEAVLRGGVQVERAAPTLAIKQARERPDASAKRPRREDSAD